MLDIFHPASPNARARGNALFLILIAVALFAALSYAVTQSGRGGGNITRETAAIQASQMMQYLASLRTGMQRMVLNGCSIPGISVADTLLSNVYATPALADSCRLFKLDGGGATYVKPAADINGGTNIGFYGNFDITGDHNYSELMAVVPNVSQQMCQQWNAKTSIGAAVPQYTAGAYTLSNYWRGDTDLIAAPYHWGFTGRCPECYELPAFCVQFTDTVTFAGIATYPAGYYAFYALLEK